MLIANPIYDVVFKYLMEDTEIARGLLSKIIEKGIKTLEFEEKDFEDDELLRKIATRLRRAATEEELLRKIEIEEEVESTIEKHIRRNQELAEKNSELASELSKKEKALSEKDKALSEKDRLIEELQRRLKNE